MQNLKNPRVYRVAVVGGGISGLAATNRLLERAKGSQQAYQDAVKRFQADRTAAGQAGAQLATMAPNQFKAQLGELGALQTVGEQQQKHNEANKVRISRICSHRSDKSQQG